ncbi:short-chain dehydrogenase [Aquimarina hainanensis]|uniref:Short-chain dehydrogenase n=1 Tax=Aquimarina hainanensis TaxID=1578017 RepID=A0ABW5NC71_9FLAO|nr:short-chain dehydrogenase [Aquimarina sp. TRL1]QKX06390.1 short-chain dehydrogenase [Aquimarina sp. TRL1]
MRIQFLLIISFLFCSCFNEKSDKALLEQDKLALESQLDSDKVLLYKFGKICIRSAGAENHKNQEYQKFKKTLDKVSNTFLSEQAKSPEEWSLMDYINLYKDYNSIKKFIKKTDEDSFPTLLEVFHKISGDSILVQHPIAEKNDKEFIQNMEHALLSIIVIASRDLGKEISLYESAKTHPERLPDGEIKALLQFFRGFLFFEKKLFYLSEDEISKNIEWLEKHPTIDLAFTRTIFQWGKLDNKKTHIAFHAINHLFRGFDRLMMDREIDEKRALKDFESFISDAKEIGLDNEIVWAIETFLYLKNEEPEKAIIAIKKLKTSPLLSNTERASMNESITYLQNRETGKVLNGVYDKYFLSKVATKYMISILIKVDWKKLMKAHEIPYTDEVFDTIDSFNHFIENIDKYSNMETIENAGKTLKDEGSKLWDKAKELLPEKEE